MSKVIGNYWTGEVPDELAPCCEVQDCEYCNEPDCHTPLEPGESFTWIALSCAVVLAGFMAVLWMLP